MKDKEILLIWTNFNHCQKEKTSSQQLLPRLSPAHAWASVARTFFFLYSLSEFYDFLWSAKVKHVVCWYPYLSRPVGNLDTKFTLAWSCRILQQRSYLELNLMAAKLYTHRDRQDMC